jgi:hypothetical protein
MNRLLKLDALLGRIQGYARMRANRMISAPKEGLATLKPEAAYMLQ